MRTARAAGSLQQGGERSMDGTTSQQPADASASQLSDIPPPVPEGAWMPDKPTTSSSSASRTSASGKRTAVPTASGQVKTTMEMVAGHWCQPNVGVAIPPSEFYELVTKEVMARNFPGVEFSRVYWREEMFVGAKREYLRVQRGRIVFDICAAPQGAGSFFSSWLCIVPPQISAAHLIGNLVAMILLGWLVPILRLPVAVMYGIPLIIGSVIWMMLSGGGSARPFRVDFRLGLTGFGPLALFFSSIRPTYYQIDAAIIFQSLVQNATLSVIDKLCEQQNARRLTEQERAPVLREFMKK